MSGLLTEWSMWGEWGACSSELYCGAGIKTRQRVCIGLNRDDAVTCQGHGEENVYCDAISCRGRVYMQDMHVHVCKCI